MLRGRGPFERACHRRVTVASAPVAANRLTKGLHGDYAEINRLGNTPANVPPGRGAPLLVTIRRLLILVVLVGATAAVAIGPDPAAAAPKPCWKRLINDWYDGRIDNVYPVKCYREAIKHLPEDVESYSDAREDIQRALLSAIRASGGELGPNDPVPAQQGGSQAGGDDQGQTTTEPGAAGGNGGDDGGGEAAPPPKAGGDDGVLGAVKPANADSVPIPLLVLAGLALVLLAAAAAGFAARRIQARRVRVSELQFGNWTPRYPMRSLRCLVLSAHRRRLEAPHGIGED